MAFHARIYELSGFAPLQGLWPTMESLTRKFLYTSRSFLSTETLIRTHKAILAALADRDEAALEEAAREHTRGSAHAAGGGERAGAPGCRR